MIKITDFWETRRVASMGEMRNAYKLLVGKQEEKTPLGTLKHRPIWKDYIKMDLKEMGREGVDWIRVSG
jgi:hypothetical protein